MRHRHLLLLLAALALLLAACDGEDAPEPADPDEPLAGEEVPAEDADPGAAETVLVADLEPGDCFLAVGGEVGSVAISEVSEVLVVDCAETHDAEVFARAELDDELSVTSPQLDAAGGAACLEDGRFEDYAGRPFDEEEGLEVTALRGTTDEEGTTTEVVCAAYRPLPGTVADGEEGGEDLVEEGEAPESQGAPGATAAEPKQGSLRDGG